MTTLLQPDPHHARLLWFCGLGSLGIHGLIITLMTLAPHHLVTAKPVPTVKVNLIAPTSPEEPTRANVAQPLMPSQPFAQPPAPISASPSMPQPPRSVIQAALSPPKPSHSLPALSSRPSHPILQDRRAIQALQARTLMKMKANPSSLLPAPPEPSGSPVKIPSNTSTNSPIFPSLKTQRPTHNPTTLPPLPGPSTLTARPPGPTGGSFSRPTILSSPKPRYPRVARESGWEGTVVLRMLIGKSGTPDQIRIRKSSGYPILDRSAQETAQRWKFMPAKDGNIPVAKWVDIPIKFDLDQS